MDGILLDVCEVFAPNEQAAREARARWIARGETLDIMYSAIEGLNAAQLETKNYIYDKLSKVIYSLVYNATY